jgi:ubiquinone biosynthesis protein COQ9
MFLNKRENITISEMEFIISLQQVIMYYEGNVLRDSSIPNGKKDLIKFMLVDMRKELTDSIGRVKQALEVEERVKELMNPYWTAENDSVIG